MNNICLLKPSKIFLLFVVLNLCACGSSDYEFVGANNSNDSAQSAPVSQGIDVSNATALECVNGGKVYSVFIDNNQNGLKDSGETILSSQIVCNGVNGIAGNNGLSTVFSVNRVTTGLTACSAGSGLQVNLGLDQNFNLALEPSEITQAQVLCDGERGATGATGSNGTNGHSLVVQTLSAPTNVCPAGGTTLLLAQDIHDNGIYDVNAPNQQAVNICNGQQGQTPAYSPVESIQPCGNTVAYKEVLLRLQNGQVLGSFSNDTSGSMTRLAFLPDGTFMNTDGSGCVFSLATAPDGKTRSISWSGQAQLTWDMP